MDNIENEQKIWNFSCEEAAAAFFYTHQYMNFVSQSTVNWLIDKVINQAELKGYQCTCDSRIDSSLPFINSININGHNGYLYCGDKSTRDADCMKIIALNKSECLLLLLESALKIEVETQKMMM